MSSGASAASESSTRRTSSPGPCSQPRRCHPRPPPQPAALDLLGRLAQVRFGAGQEFLGGEDRSPGQVAACARYSSGPIRGSRKPPPCARPPAAAPATGDGPRSRPAPRPAPAASSPGTCSPARSLARGPVRPDQPLGPGELDERGLHVHLGHRAARHGRAAASASGTAASRRATLRSRSAAVRSPGPAAGRWPGPGWPPSDSTRARAARRAEPHPGQVVGQDLRVHPVLRGELGQVDRRARRAAPRTSGPARRNTPRCPWSAGSSWR